MTYVSSTSESNRHAVFAIERKPPPAITAIGTGVSGMVGQFPWGPTKTLVSPSSRGNLIDTFCPPGMGRTSSGYLALTGPAFANLRVVRVEGSGAAKAAATLDASATDIITVTLKHTGAAGNNVTLTVSAATDGDANHFNLTATVTGADGTTTDTFQDLNYSGVGADSEPDFSEATLVGAISVDNAGRPDDVSAAPMAGGADGTVAAADYVGTTGAPDHGLSLLEGDKAIRHVFVDDCGDGLRTAVNAGLKAHALATKDRVAYMSGNKSQTLAESIADGNQGSDRVWYHDSWVGVLDQQTGAVQEVPGAPFVASVASQMSPSTSPAYKALEVRNMLTGIQYVVNPRGSGVSSLNAAGIGAFIKEESGGHAIEGGYTTAWKADKSIGLLTRRRMTDYIILSAARALRPWLDAPNVDKVQQDEIDALKRFLAGLRDNAKTDPIHLPHIVAFQIGDLESFNPDSDLDQGIFKLPLSCKLSADQRQVYLMAEIGSTVQVTEVAA